MKTIVIDEIVDMIAKPDTQIQVEFQRQLTGHTGIKLYVHVDGKTVLRIGFIKESNIELNIEPLAYRLVAKQK